MTWDVAEIHRATRVAAFQESRVDRAARVFNEDVILANGELHFAAIFAQGTLKQIHGTCRDNGDIAKRGGLANGLGRAVHFRQTPAIRADCRELVIFPFELHAAESVAAAFVIRCKNRAADQLPK